MDQDVRSLVDAEGSVYGEPHAIAHIDGRGLTQGCTSESFRLTSTAIVFASRRHIIRHTLSTDIHDKKYTARLHLMAPFKITSFKTVVQT